MVGQKGTGTKYVKMNKRTHKRKIVKSTCQKSYKIHVYKINVKNYRKKIS